MRHVVFKTPGLLDIRSLTVFGLSAKPNADGHPIGKFGTGLKMAIAVLVRNNIPVVIWIGSTKYKFSLVRTGFRGAEYHQIRMDKEVHGLGKIMKRRNELLPFTTELAKYWELWQAFRELESNTRDEKGETMLITLDDPQSYFRDMTYIIVSGEAFAKEYLERERTFLPDGLTLRDDSSGSIQIIERPSAHVYWRGIRVHDLPKDAPSELTYNILDDIELTEDRTAKSPYDIESKILHAVAKTEDADLAKKVVEAPKGSYEHNLNYSYTYYAPSPTFRAAARKPEANPRAAAYAKSYDSAPPKADPWKDYPRPWRTDKFDATRVTLLDDNGAIVGEKIHAKAAELILARVNEDPTPIPF